MLQELIRRQNDPLVRPSQVVVPETEGGLQRTELVLPANELLQLERRQARVAGRRLQCWAASRRSGVCVCGTHRSRTRLGKCAATCGAERHRDPCGSRLAPQVGYLGVGVSFGLLATTTNTVAITSLVFAACFFGEILWA